MTSKFKSSIGNQILLYLPLLLLFISVFNEFDFNYLHYEYFSFNFPFILIFYWSLKRIEILGYGYTFSDLLTILSCLAIFVVISAYMLPKIKDNKPELKIA